MLMFDQLPRSTLPRAYLSNSKLGAGAHKPQVKSDLFVRNFKAEYMYMYFKDNQADYLRKDLFQTIYIMYWRFNTIDFSFSISSKRLLKFVIAIGSVRTVLYTQNRMIILISKENGLPSPCSVPYDLS